MIDLELEKLEARLVQMLDAENKIGDGIVREYRNFSAANDPVERDEARSRLILQCQKFTMCRTGLWGLRDQIRECKGE